GRPRAALRRTVVRERRAPHIRSGQRVPLALLLRASGSWSELMLTDLLDPAVDARAARGYGGLFYGVDTPPGPGITRPPGQGRVRIRLPWSPDASGKSYEAWARLATFMAGNNRGGWFIPDVQDEVLVAFEAGDTRHPYVLGGLWNGSDTPPESMDGAGKNNKKTLRSRNAVVVTLDDADG